MGNQHLYSIKLKCLFKKKVCFFFLKGGISGVEKGGKSEACLVFFWEALPKPD